MSHLRNIIAAYVGLNLILVSFNEDLSVIVVFLVFFMLEALSSAPNTNMFNLRSLLSLRLSTLSLTTRDKSAITVFLMSAREVVI